jgi:thiol-disulfide isomerase/thioredoxin
MILGLVLALALQAPVADDHEYSDLVQISASSVFEEYVSENPSAGAGELEELQELFRFHDFYGPDLAGENINFHLPSKPGYEPAKVLLLSYTAEWCKNCNYEAPYLSELYGKYHARGLEIVTRTEYSEVDKVREFIARHKMQYPVIIGSIVAYDDRESIRMETFQYLLRKALGDSRKWGTPFNIIVIDGDIENPYIVVGEMKSDQMNELIERTLSGTQ